MAVLLKYENMRRHVPKNALKLALFCHLHKCCPKWRVCCRHPDVTKQIPFILDNSFPSFWKKKNIPWSISQLWVNPLSSWFYVVVAFLSLALYEISQLLNTGLNRETLSILVQLCDNGVNPEGLAQVRPSLFMLYVHCARSSEYFWLYQAMSFRAYTVRVSYSYNG